ncbi:MAG: DUF1275 domain-containing protein [Atopobiaceae bacterium]|nr:DUF1275 domain-containing protein [Atopobiaceae bacterium]
MAPTDNQAALIPSQRMRVAFILTAVGGFLDAYTYFERGGVFANAQTGNIVKLGISLANGARDKYLFYLLPICAFAVGLMTSLAIKEILERRGVRLVRRTVLAVEIVGLAIVGFIPLGEQWDRVANCIVSFVAAMQYETFTTFRGEAIVTTMSTGNLRKMVDALFLGIIHNDIDKILRASLFFAIIATFTFGAFLGTRACDAMGRAAVVPAIGALALVIAIISILRERNHRRS